MWLVMASDFVLLNAILLVYMRYFEELQVSNRQFFIVNNIALLISEWKFHARIHERFATAGEVLRRLMLLTGVQALLAYAMMRHVMYWMATGELVLIIGTVFFVLLLISRLISRNIIKLVRRMGLNSRSVTMVGDDAELQKIRDLLINDPTTGYRIGKVWKTDELREAIKKGEQIEFGDELYVCLSRKERDTIRLLSRECDRQLTQFFYVPVSVESIGLKFQREYINDIEVFTTHESPLQNPMNKMVKRCMDIALSIVFLIPTAIIFPFVYVIIKIQSPGPLFFRQERTGLDGKNFKMVKFRSMHVNKDADKIQATKDDPRKYPFGNFMRKANIDELPQFWNVLMGNMSIVGPRPHMLAHTEMYSELIDKYMVRHFVKPGITGWAQVTGFRGETKELWQMEGRVQRDIWYIENWTVWLDIRIIWLTFKTFFVHDKNAY